MLAAKLEKIDAVPTNQKPDDSKKLKLVPANRNASGSKNEKIERWFQKNQEAGGSKN